jgi:hypothetical protein
MTFIVCCNKRLSIHFPPSHVVFDYSLAKLRGAEIGIFNRIEIAGNLKAFFENNFNGNEYTTSLNNSWGH